MKIILITLVTMAMKRKHKHKHTRKDKRLYNKLPKNSILLQLAKTCEMTQILNLTLNRKSNKKSRRKSLLMRKCGQKVK